MYYLKINPEIQNISSVPLLTTYLHLKIMSSGKLKSEKTYCFESNQSMYQNVIVHQFDLFTDHIIIQWDFYEKWQKDGQLLAYIIRSFIDNLQIKFDPLSSSKECYITAPIRSDNALDSNDDLFQVTTKLTGYTELYETPKTIITDVEGVKLKADPREVSSEFINVLEDTVTEVERLITYRNGSITLKGGGKI